jgi:hypothetical protein
VVVFRGEEGEEAWWLYGAGGERHSEERCDSQGGRRQRLVSGGRRWSKEIGSVVRMGGWAEPLTKPIKKYD